VNVPFGLILTVFPHALVLVFIAFLSFIMMKIEVLHLDICLSHHVREGGNT
jgi:hypothetical protein